MSLRCVATREMLWPWARTAYGVVHGRNSISASPLCASSLSLLCRVCFAPTSPSSEQNPGIELGTASPDYLPLGDPQATITSTRPPEPSPHLRLVRSVLFPGVCPPFTPESSHSAPGGGWHRGRGLGGDAGTPEEGDWGKAGGLWEGMTELRRGGRGGPSPR